MVLSRAVTEQLGALTAALDDPGLTITLQQDGLPVTLTTIHPDLALTAGASLALPLTAPTGAGTGGIVVFYAGNPGAFGDLAADTRRVRDPVGRVVPDGHLPSRSHPPHRPGITGLADLSVVNRAIGVLITRGHTLGEARAELRRRAADNLHGVPAAARKVLASTNAPLHRVATAPSSAAGQMNAPQPRRGANAPAALFLLTLTGRDIGPPVLRARRRVAVATALSVRVGTPSESGSLP